MEENKKPQSFTPQDGYCDKIYSRYLNDLSKTDLAEHGKIIIEWYNRSHSSTFRKKFESTKILTGILRKYMALNVMFRGFSPDDDVLRFHKSTLDMLTEISQSDNADTDKLFCVIRNYVLMLSNIMITAANSEYKKIVRLRTADFDIDLTVRYLYKRRKFLGIHDRASDILGKLLKPTQNKIFFLVFLVPGLREIALLYFLIIMLLALIVKPMQKYVLSYIYLCFSVCLTFSSILKVYDNLRIFPEQTDLKPQETEAPALISDRKIHMLITANTISLLENGAVTITCDGLFTQDGIKLASVTACKEKKEKFSLRLSPLLADSTAADELKKLGLISEITAGKNKSVIKISNIPLLSVITQFLDLSYINTNHNALSQKIRFASDTLKSLTSEKRTDETERFLSLMNDMVLLSEKLFEGKADLKDTDLFLCMNSLIGIMSDLITAAENTYSNQKPGLKEYEMTELFTVFLSLPYVIYEYFSQFYRLKGRLPACSDGWLWNFDRLGSDDFWSAFYKYVCFAYPGLSVNDLLNAHSFPVNAALDKAYQLHACTELMKENTVFSSLAEIADDCLINKAFVIKEKKTEDDNIYMVL